MNSSKIHSLIVELHDDLALLQWFLDRGDNRACRDIIRYLYILGQDIDRLEDKLMEKDFVRYGDLISIIEQYIDQEGITKTCAQIMTVLANQLNDKVKLIEPALTKEKIDRIVDSIPLGADHKSPSSFGAGAGSESGTPGHPEGLTLVLEREYTK